VWCWSAVVFAAASERGVETLKPAKGVTRRQAPNCSPQLPPRQPSPARAATAARTTAWQRHLAASFCPALLGLASAALAAAPRPQQALATAAGPPPAAAARAAAAATTPPPTVAAASSVSA
jgi:hypothetical protein